MINTLYCFYYFYSHSISNITSKILNTNPNKNIDQHLPEILQNLSHLNKEELVMRFISLELNRFGFADNNKKQSKSQQKKHLERCF